MHLTSEYFTLPVTLLLYGRVADLITIGQNKPTIMPQFCVNLATLDKIGTLSSLTGTGSSEKSSMVSTS